ncbi:hypothetical protein EPUS_00957 [Endocarpon pusillum Z07020]|uniref:Protein kinase domain-containing protein n=1 Tax=Endocarpon pusillum (strain Z07020 / HMAS-L-300199) TaxID=1263415 RepID=U1GN57_ENDPU|nr:uncharacterized protein EPUS_00957 [Endocarpon pusillum Z07020]ERF73703.1 hypothetical protein EPUS_00957 [Endocarpon pusillum Z07020]
MPRHPNIICPPEILVVTSKIQDGGQMFLCGTLYPFMKNDSLDQVVNKSPITKTRLPLKDKAKWCHQLASALSHTHFKANTYHINIKLGNFLLNDDEDLFVTDWEESEAPSSTLAPEANGCWDVESIRKPRRTAGDSSTSTSMFVYKKYEGTPRQHLWSWPEWNVFPTWREECPEALEKAEVFSLGRTMWMVLGQVASTCDIDVDSMVSWDESASDIPQHWKHLVPRCVEADPNKRIGLSELTGCCEYFRREH